MHVGELEGSGLECVYIYIKEGVACLGLLKEKEREVGVCV